MRFGRHLLAWALVALFGSASWAGEPLRVMTFNIRYGTAADGRNIWPLRQALLVETIKAFNPDLLGTQETLAAQADFLSAQLSDFTLVGVGRDDGKRRGELSALMFRTKRFELLDSGTFWLSETPDAPGSKSWDSSLPRIATWVKLRDRENNQRELCYLNTHWDHQGQQARVESGKIIRNWLNQHAAKLSAIVTGDLNVHEDHAGIRALLAADANPVLVDVFRRVHAEAGKDEATFHGFNGRITGRRIDFIFASPDLVPRESSIDHTNRDGRYPSDHYPVTAVLDVK